jgi:hypothetical protein
MPIKTFRGLIADEGIASIPLRTNTGSTGYRIVKFELFPNEAGQQNQESTAKIYKTPQTAATNEVDFSDQTLLAAAYYQDGTDVNQSGSMFVVFDKEVFNQDIYITHEDTASDQPVNYYIELEPVKLDITENTVATLKDIRNIVTQG